MKITAAENGPILIEANETRVIRQGKEEVITRKIIALCRCGQSSNKPFCDGAHKKSGFIGEVVELEVK